MAFLLACALLWWSRPTSRLLHPVIGEPLEVLAPLDVYDVLEEWNGGGGLAWVDPESLDPVVGSARTAIG
jgi:hypothetical protein